jgi:hypothetical protein
MDFGRCATDRGKHHGWWHTKHLKPELKTSKF